MASFSVQDVILCVIVVVLTKWFIGLLRSFWQGEEHLSPLPPGPPGLPVLGNLALLRTDMRGVFSRLAEEYGGVFSFRVGPIPVVVVCDVEAVNEAFLVQGEAFADRAIPPLLRYAIGSKGTFTFDNGPEWRARRRFGLSAMRNLGMGKSSMERRITEEARLLCESFENNKSVTFDPKELVTKAVTNVICSISFGSRFDYDDPLFENFVVKVHQAVSSVSFFSPGNALPFLFHSPLYSDFRYVVEFITDTVQRIMGEHRRTLDEHDVRDIIDLFILEIRRQQKCGEEIVFDDDLAWRGIFDLFAAGSTTTSAVLLWGLLFLAKFPDTMKEVQDEIDRVVGDHRSPSMSDQDAMPVTMATIMEIQRFRHVAPLGVPRKTNKEATIKGYRIPKGTAVVMNLWELMMSPTYWDQPEDFRPSRFLSEDGKTVLKPDAFIPFGIGNRICMGQLLAKMELFLFLTNILQRFTVHLADDSRDVSLDGQAGIGLVPDDFKIKIQLR
ncbi:cytochrome P450 2U1-like [Diadema setosum]|uniref:cytochrome P450 2U1-like n=1 Tax=Diadema setosum TaxID=31175 RepID=UPI003B3B6A43